MKPSIAYYIQFICILGMLFLFLYMGSGTFQDSIDLYYDVDYMKAELTPPFNNIIAFGVLFSTGILFTTIIINKHKDE